MRGRSTSGGVHGPPAGVARSALELGQGMRALRSRSLRALEREQVAMLSRSGTHKPLSVVVAKSSLARYETGTLPPLELADHLDQLYEARGWVAMGLRSLWRPRWDPWALPDAVPRRSHFVAWPAPYEGLVWLKLMPARDGVGEMHDIRLRWGAWGVSAHVMMPRTGIVLATGKACDADGVAVTLEVASERATHALHGTGEDLVGDQVIDLRGRWTPAA